MSQTIYPPVYNGTYPYTTPLERLNLTVAEQLIICSPYYLGRAYQNAAYNYISSSPASGVKYDVDNGVLSSSSLPNSTVTQALNTYLMHFASRGNPSSDGLPGFPSYGGQSVALNMGASGISTLKDPSANARCDWWALGLVYANTY